MTTREIFNNKGMLRTVLCWARNERCIDPVETNGSRNMRAPAVGRRAHGHLVRGRVALSSQIHGWAVRELQRRICEVGCDSTASESKERAEEVAREWSRLSAVDSTNKSSGMETKQTAGATGSRCDDLDPPRPITLPGTHLNPVVPALPAGRPLATADGAGSPRPTLLPEPVSAKLTAAGAPARVKHHFLSPTNPTSRCLQHEDDARAVPSTEYTRPFVQ
jgi:hypothetical protein